MGCGNCVVFYDRPTGIGAIFGYGGADAWIGSDIILIDNAIGAVWVGKGLAYITPSGIEFMSVSWTELEELFNIAYEKKKGNNATAVEKVVQEKWRKKRKETSHLMGTGAIAAQRISGYVTPDSVTRVFYYQDDVIVCIESSDLTRWHITDNF